MKLLLDQDVYPVAQKFLKRLKHDVVPVGHYGLSQADDLDLLKKAEKEKRIFVTETEILGTWFSLDV